MRTLLVTLCLALALPAAFPVLAQDELARDELGTLIGLGVRSRPDYDGASRQELEPIPVITTFSARVTSVSFVSSFEGIRNSSVRPMYTDGSAQ